MKICRRHLPIVLGILPLFAAAEPPNLPLNAPHAVLAVSADSIRLNQIGFYPGGSKVAVVLGVGESPFHVVDAQTSDTVYSGMLTALESWSYSEEYVSRADFSDLREEGTYVVAVPGLGTSHSFRIAPKVHEDVALAGLKGFYYQRGSASLPASYAGLWSRPSGHPDTSVLIHPSAATPERPANSTISSPLGWYDAGDYNKYIINSGISTYTLMAAYEHFPKICDSLSTDIPESDSELPDILDEVLWNLRWMLTMQDPGDGGVYAKLTNPDFDGWVMPAAAQGPRYVVQKSTGAALDFAAVTAQAARVFGPFASALPGLADSCLEASLEAWRWARLHPSLFYRQSEINEQYDPDINTGEYGDWSFDDEWDWAAAELYVTTGADSFLAIADPTEEMIATVPNWQKVRTLALYSIAHHRRRLTPTVDTARVIGRLVILADYLRSMQQASPYGVVIGAEPGDFSWGSNGTAANQGMALLVAFSLTGDTTYLDAAQATMDYLLGRNATTYCFLTGVGSRPPMHPHHRPSEADGVLDPVPGLLMGGPNPRQEDGLDIYPSDLPARSYVDHRDSYASNEFAINWNAAFVYLALGLEAYDRDREPVTTVEPEAGEGPQGFRLMPNYPNPFNPGTMIEFAIPSSEYVELKVFDSLGREVAMLVHEEKASGTYRVAWSPGEAASSGIYFCRLTAGSFVETKKLVLLR